MPKINTTQKPFIPAGFELESHDTSLGEIDVKDIELYLTDEQKGGDIKGTKLKEKLKGKPVLNVVVLDYLLAHPELIPDEWKSKLVFFFGTIYRFSAGILYVRYLYWRDGQWSWSYCWLGIDWDDSCPATVLKSSSNDTLPSELPDELIINNVKYKRYD